MRQRSISHSVLGKYEQLIFDTPQEAGHTDLASQGKYGWEIPVDLPTSALLDYVAGKAVLDLGCGWGNTIAIPAMERGAKEVYALDVTPEHLDDNSPLVHKARELGYASLQPVLLREDWWQSALASHPKAQPLLQSLKGETRQLEALTS